MNRNSLALASKWQMLQCQWPFLQNPGLVLLEQQVFDLDMDETMLHTGERVRLGLCSSDDLFTSGPPVCACM